MISSLAEILVWTEISHNLSALEKSDPLFRTVQRFILNKEWKELLIVLIGNDDHRNQLYINQFKSDSSILSLSKEEAADLIDAHLFEIKEYLLKDFMVSSRTLLELEILSVGNVYSKYEELKIEKDIKLIIDKAVSFFRNF